MVIIYLFIYLCYSYISVTRHDNNVNKMSFIMFANTKNPIETLFIIKKAKYSNWQSYPNQYGAVPQLVVRWVLMPTTRVQVMVKTSYLHKCYPLSTQCGLTLKSNASPSLTMSVRNWT